jgi:hypothetical protein
MGRRGEAGRGQVQLDKAGEARRDEVRLGRFRQAFLTKGDLYE